jgi:hypothetical protein
MPSPFASLLRLILFGLFPASVTTMSVAAAFEQPRQVPLRPSDFVLLARDVTGADRIRQWEFADLTLDALLDAYVAELEASRRESRSTPEQRAKLARWQRGTAELIESLRRLRLRLAAGADLAVRLDSRQQVLLFVDGEAVVVSGPRAETEPEIERRIVERFCATNDCGPLAVAGADTLMGPPEEAGLWVLDQESPPAFEIGTELRFEFRGLAARDRKAQAALRTAEELRQLHDALQQALSQGYRVDWDRLSGSRPVGGSDRRVILNTQGAYLPLDLPHLARLRDADWKRIVTWLRRGGPGVGGVLAIRQADDLLGGLAGE